jgi:hypothetical protein
MAYQQITRGQFRQQLLERLGGAGTSFWRTDELNGIINESLRVWNSITGFWRTRQLITTSVDTVYYLVNGTITSSLRVSFNDHSLIPSGLVDLDMGQEFWESQTTASANTPNEPTVYGIGALNLIAIWPADHAGGNKLVVDGIATTPVLTADNQFVDIGTEELSLLLDYCEHICLFKEGGAEFLDTIPNKNNPDTLFTTFLKGAAARNNMLAHSEVYRKWMGGDTAGRQKNPMQSAQAAKGAR